MNSQYGEVNKFSVLVACSTKERVRFSSAPHEMAIRWVNLNLLKLCRDLLKHTNESNQHFKHVIMSVDEDHNILNLRDKNHLLRTSKESMPFEK